ncbi:MAG: DNA replication and repair protein RecF [Solirubrobacterales bacterium]
MLVLRASARPLRSLGEVEVELPAGVCGVVGENGTGKTNLLEAIYFALTGRSFRTSERREMIPFGEALARAAATVRSEEGEHSFMASVSRSEGRRHLLDGAPVEARTAARHRPPAAVFSPDRLALVKGPPAERRAHLDLFVAARWPARASLRREFGQALAQRNALLSRIGAGAAGAGELDSWDATLAAAAAELVAAREAAVLEIASHFPAISSELGLPGEAALVYAPRAAGDAERLLAGLAERRQGDLRLGRTSWGPHLDEVRIESSARSLRRYGSQGQQRLALLALLFAEREALRQASGVLPLMLLDDVLSELDDRRRGLLAERLRGGGQALLTTSDAGSLPPGLAGEAIRMPGAARAPRAVAA